MKAYANQDYSTPDSEAKTNLTKHRILLMQKLQINHLSDKINLEAIAIAETFTQPQHTTNDRLFGGGSGGGGGATGQF